MDLTPSINFYSHIPYYIQLMDLLKDQILNKNWHSLEVGSPMATSPLTTSSSTTIPCGRPPPTPVQVDEYRKSYEPYRELYHALDVSFGKMGAVNSE